VQKQQMTLVYIP